MGVPSLNLSFSHLECIETIGDGSSSEVLLVRVPSYYEQPVALKVMRKEFLLKYGRAKQARTERQILERLAKEHQGIVELLFTFQDGLCVYMGLEYCAKGELFEWIRRHEGLSIEATRFYTAQLTDAAAFLHSRSIAHCDMKPENCLLSREFHMKLCDFGSAVDLEETPQAAPDSDEREEIPYLGSIEYAPPELLHGGASPSPAFDVFALGLFACQVRTAILPSKADGGRKVALDECFCLLSHDEKDLVDFVQAATSSAETRPRAKSLAQNWRYLSAIDFDRIWLQEAPAFSASCE